MTKIAHHETFGNQSFIIEMKVEGYMFALKNYHFFMLIKDDEPGGGTGTGIGFNLPPKELMEMIDKLNTSDNQDDTVIIRNEFGKSVDLPKKLLPDLSVFLRTFLLCDANTPPSRLREIYENLTS